jgi:hypothetical protein
MMIEAHLWRRLITFDGVYAIEVESALFRRAMTQRRRVAMREIP